MHFLANSGIGTSILLAPLIQINYFTILRSFAMSWQLQKYFMQEASISLHKYSHVEVATLYSGTSRIIENRLVWWDTYSFSWHPQILLNFACPNRNFFHLLNWPVVNHSKSSTFFLFARRSSWFRALHCLQRTGARSVFREKDCSHGQDEIPN